MRKKLTLAEVVALKKEICFSIHCALPGVVESFDPETQTACVQPAVKRGSIFMPLLQDVPVFMPIPFEVNPGDACLLVFADYDVEAWLKNGEVEEPVSERMHSLSDAFAFVGFRVNCREGENNEIPSDG